MGTSEADGIRSLRTLLDSYLIGDLTTMSTITKPTGLGYPMVQTILSGMELVGMLMSGARQGGAFDKFFKELVVDFPAYKGSASIFRQAVRNRTSHIFLLPIGVQLTKDRVGHLTRVDDHILSIDVNSLLDDFRYTYERVMDEMEEGKRPALGLRVLGDELTKVLKQTIEFASSRPAFPKPTESSTMTSGAYLCGSVIAASATTLGFAIPKQQ